MWKVEEILRQHHLFCCKFQIGKRENRIIIESICLQVGTIIFFGAKFCQNAIFFGGHDPYKGFFLFFI